MIFFRLCTVFTTLAICFVTTLSAQNNQKINYKKRFIIKKVIKKAKQDEMQEETKQATYLQQIEVDELDSKKNEQKKPKEIVEKVIVKTVKDINNVYRSYLAGSISLYSIKRDVSIYFNNQTTLSVDDTKSGLAYGVGYGVIDSNNNFYDLYFFSIEDLYEIDASLARELKSSLKSVRINTREHTPYIKASFGIGYTSFDIKAPDTYSFGLSLGDLVYINKNSIISFEVYHKNRYREDLKTQISVESWNDRENGINASFKYLL